MKRGLFITLEGNDGAGKTTMAKKALEYLQKKGYRAIYTREPGGSMIAEKIRTILLDPENTKMDAITEAILYAASRRQHLVEVVLPALEEGTIVLCDRFIDSSLAYQGEGRKLGMDAIEQLNQFAIQGCMPAPTLFLALDEKTSQARLKARDEKKDRLELEEEAFHQAVRRGYEKLLKKYPERIRAIDASQDLEDVEADVIDAIEKVLHVQS